NCPSLLRVAHQLASASEVTSSENGIHSVFSVPLVPFERSNRSAGKKRNEFRSPTPRLRVLGKGQNWLMVAHQLASAYKSGTDTVSAEELKKVHDLGSKLFFQAAIGPGYSSATADDYPAVIVRRLEESAEGCGWLLARWAELLNVLNRKATWRDPEIIRFVGLLGKRGIEAHFDPELNSLFHAFDALGHRIGHKFWNERRDGLPLGYIGGFQFVPYRE